MLMILFLTILLLLFILIILNAVKRPKNYPPGPKWLPFVGNTHELRNLSRQLKGQHQVFKEWSKKYGPVLGLKLGNEFVVVVLTYPLIKHVHTSGIFDGRPNNFFLRLRTMGTRLGITCTDGSLWAEQRSFATRHLRQSGFGRQPMELQIKNELFQLYNVIDMLGSTPERPGNFLPQSVLNVLWIFTAGTKLARHDARLKRLFDLLNIRSKIFDMAGGILNQMPWLRFIAPEKTGYNLLKNFNQELHEFFMETINEHHENYTEEKCNDDLIYAFIKEMKEQSGHETTFTNKQLTMTILDIFIAGSQTTSTTIDLALMMMLIRPDIQTKIQNEIDAASINVDKLENETKLNRVDCSYCDAYLMEVQRFFDIIPVNGPRRALSETWLNGYCIPNNTTVLMSLYSIHKDKEYWGDPDKFRPERFLDENMKVVYNDHLMPFGQGKRRCLGDALARSCMFTFFTGILKRYNLTIPDGDKIPSVDLLPGITLSPKPYKILFTKR